MIAMVARPSALLALMMAVSYCPAQTQPIQQGAGRRIDLRITGRLTDARELPIAGAAIGLARWDATVWQPLARSSATGSFELRVGLQAGAYKVIAAFGRFVIARKEVKVVNSAGRILQIYLRPSDDEARSDEPPDTTPITGLLPPGSFPEMQGGEPVRSGVPAAGGGGGGGGGPGSANQELVNVFYITNRAPVAGVAAVYSDHPLVQMETSYGVCTVSIPPVHQPGQVERPSIFRIRKVEDVNKYIVITARELIPGEGAFQQRLHQAFRESGSEAFLFIHGYNVGFDDAVRRTAQLFRDLKFDGVPILFSWPGQDAWWRYPAAEDVVDLSARQLEEFLLHTLAHERVKAVNVIAHSMGNRILMTALDRLALRNVNTAFNNIVMAAPDINVADFNAVSGILRRSAKRTTIYSSSRDLALQFSKAFHSYARLGEAPPVRLVPGIDTIDASAIRQDLLGHSYFGDSGSVIHDLVLLLKTGLSPQARLLQPASLGAMQYWRVPGE